MGIQISGQFLMKLTNSVLLGSPLQCRCSVPGIIVHACSIDAASLKLPSRGALRAPCVPATDPTRGARPAAPRPRLASGLFSTKNAQSLSP